uniref:Methyltransferase domain-containing protein n=1 Tax=Chromera velia CCMP2878 TaxID=1169474 RepID=A0A0G4I8J9_9ALVE|eukprot:Cvel_1972.t1-p1 / transcript=Cvel_1972.t1 / gene=Cvel_1972 / organism=Chromera_velia_CCMP2878 / gene_product=hypothetical protein / transcript_product=hypothetical protein / location=Cvel_scaffold75:22957-24054(-) / protein_length=366 / sequence_SO=supercontig / SO=protein_coding / is_pseudo=false
MRFPLSLNCRPFFLTQPSPSVTHLSSRLRMTAVSDLSPDITEVSLLEEFETFQEERVRLPVLIDLRSKREREETGSVDGATQISVDELTPRTFELPPPFEYRLSFLGSEDECQKAKLFTKQGGCQWTVSECITKSEAINRMVKEGAPADKFQRGPLGVNEGWRANVFLEFCLKKFAPVFEEAGGEGRVALDLGCGNGRDGVFLAAKTGIRVVGSDNHDGALARARALTADLGLAGLCEWKQCDLRKNGKSVEDCQRELLREDRSESVGLIHGHRFLERRLLPVCRDLLACRGLFVWSTFASVDGEILEERPGPPYKAGRLLREGELREVFESSKSDCCFEIIFDEMGTLLSHGVEVNAHFFLARKK